VFRADVRGKCRTTCLITHRVHHKCETVLRFFILVEFFYVLMLFKFFFNFFISLYKTLVQMELKL